MNSVSPSTTPRMMAEIQSGIGGSSGGARPAVERIAALEAIA
jgi:hypothetical protein